MNRPLVLIAPLLLAACGSGEWSATTWGEEYIEEGIPSGEFADSCSATFDQFYVVLDDVALLDGNDEAVSDEQPAMVFDLTQTGPHDLFSSEVPATYFDTVRYAVRPASDAVAGNVSDEVVSAMAGHSVHATGSLTCGEDTITFDWIFDTDTTYLCEPDDLTIPNGGTATTELTIHGDHFFYDGLENPDAEVRGQLIVDADADEDGSVTHAELAAVSIAPTGYSVGQYSDVTDLDQFITFLTRTLGHVDGEGHCQVNL